MVLKTPSDFVWLEIRVVIDDCDVIMDGDNPLEEVDWMDTKLEEVEIVLKKEVVDDVNIVDLVVMWSVIIDEAKIEKTLIFFFWKRTLAKVFFYFLPVVVGCIVVATVIKVGISDREIEVAVTVSVFLFDVVSGLVVEEGVEDNSVEDSRVDGGDGVIDVSRKTITRVRNFISKTFWSEKSWCFRYICWLSWLLNCWTW